MTANEPDSQPADDDMPQLDPWSEASEVSDRLHRIDGTNH